MTTFLRPNTAVVARKAQSATSATGEPVTAPSTIYAALPCLIDAIPVSSRMGGDIQLMVEGVVYVQTHVGFFDGLMPAQIAGYSPGQTVTVGGIGYLVAPNGRGAFPDVRVGDRITDESGQQHLVLATAMYYEVMPTLQVRLQRGRAWL